MRYVFMLLAFYLLTGMGPNQKLYEFYSVESNYLRVEQEVIKFYPPNKYNGCVAYISTATRLIGIDIPFTKVNGESISLVTKPFSDYLVKSLSWIRIEDMNKLMNGDVIFTLDEPGWPGYPAHVMMFAGWHDELSRVAVIIDNQGFKYQRPLMGNVRYSAFKYFLRAPK